MVPISIVNGVYKPSYNWGGPPCNSPMKIKTSGFLNSQRPPFRSGSFAKVTQEDLPRFAHIICFMVSTCFNSSFEHWISLAIIVPTYPYISQISLNKKLQRKSLWHFEACNGTTFFFAASGPSETTKLETWHPRRFVLRTFGWSLRGDVAHSSARFQAPVASISCWKTSGIAGQTLIFFKLSKSFWPKTAMTELIHQPTWTIVKDQNSYHWPSDERPSRGYPKPQKSGRKTQQMVGESTMRNQPPSVTAQAATKLIDSNTWVHRSYPLVI